MAAGETMTGAEKITEDEFRSIMQAELNACSDAAEVMTTYKNLQRQWTQLLIATCVICALSIGVAVASRQDPSNRIWFAAALVVFLLSLGIILRQNARLQRSIRNSRIRWEQAGLQQCTLKTMKFATDLAKKVKEFNAHVDRLAELQNGDYWRDFRSLSTNEKEYINSTYIQVRGQLLSALRTCRQLIDHPDHKIEDLSTRQLVSREQEMLNAFTAKTMSSNHYLSLAKSLTVIESELQTQLRSMATS